MNFPGHGSSDFVMTKNLSVEAYCMAVQSISSERKYSIVCSGDGVYVVVLGEGGQSDHNNDKYSYSHENSIHLTLLFSQNVLSLFTTVGGSQKWRQAVILLL